MSRDNAAAPPAEGDVIVERTDDLFGPDGTADPPPDQWYPDPLAGLTPGEIPIVEQDHKVDPNHDVLAPAVATPDAEAVREAMEAVLAAEQEAPPEPQRQRGRRSPSARPEAAQPGRLPTRGAPPMVGGSNAGRRGWAQSTASKQATRQARARARQAKPLRKQPALLIVIVLVLIVVFFNVLSSLFSWLSSAFH